MARRSFGGGTADFVIAVDSSGVLKAAAVAVHFWTDRVGGSGITDLTDATGAGVSLIVSDSHGQLPPFFGPADGTAVLWADAGGPNRIALYANDTASIIDCGGAA